MSSIIPAILPTSKQDLEHKLAALHGLVNEVQIDAVDGRFAAPATWPYNAQKDELAKFAESEEGIGYLGSMQFEADLMVADPEKVVGSWIAAGATRITIHAESTRFLANLMKEVQVKYGHAKDFAPELLSVGLALNIATDTVIIEPFLDHVDYVQFMGIKTIGKQGQPFDQQVIRKIGAFRRAHPNMTIQVDGGVSMDTAPLLLNAGVDRLVIGSGIWRAPNLAEEIKKYTDLVHEHAVYS